MSRLYRPRGLPKDLKTQLQLFAQCLASLSGAADTDDRQCKDGAPQMWDEEHALMALDRLRQVSRRVAFECGVARAALAASLGSSSSSSFSSNMPATLTASTGLAVATEESRHALECMLAHMKGRCSLDLPLKTLGCVVSPVDCGNLDCEHHQKTCAAARQTVTRWIYKGHQPTWLANQIWRGFPRSDSPAGDSAQQPRGSGLLKLRGTLESVQCFAELLNPRYDRGRLQIDMENSTEFTTREQESKYGELHGRDKREGPQTEKHVLLDCRLAKCVENASDTPQDCDESGSLSLQVTQHRLHVQDASSGLSLFPYRIARSYLAHLKATFVALDQVVVWRNQIRRFKEERLTSEQDDTLANAVVGRVVYVDKFPAASESLSAWGSATSSNVDSRSDVRRGPETRAASARCIYVDVRPRSASMVKVSDAHSVVVHQNYSMAKHRLRCRKADLAKKMQTRLRLCALLNSPSPNLKTKMRTSDALKALDARIETLRASISSGRSKLRRLKAKAARMLQQHSNAGTSLLRFSPKKLAAARELDAKQCRAIGGDAYVKCDWNTEWDKCEPRLGQMVVVLPAHSMPCVVRLSCAWICTANECGHENSERDRSAIEVDPHQIELPKGVTSALPLAFVCDDLFARNSSTPAIFDACTFHPADLRLYLLPALETCLRVSALSALVMEYATAPAAAVADFGQVVRVRYRHADAAYTRESPGFSMGEELSRSECACPLCKDFFASMSRDDHAQMCKDYAPPEHVASSFYF